jgi:hypothetical protein
MNSFVKLSVSVDIEETIDNLRQMLTCIQDNDTKGASYFFDRVNAGIIQIEDGLEVNS